jgi:hypothetical protein
VGGRGGSFAALGEARISTHMRTRWLRRRERRPRRPEEEMPLRCATLAEEVRDRAQTKLRGVRRTPAAGDRGKRWVRSWREQAATRRLRTGRRGPE